MGSGASTRGARWGRRLAAVALGLALAPLVVEGALRLLAAAAPGSRAGKAGASLALCGGDSFTYGLWLPAELAYPARLESLLVEAGAGAERVVNLGVPAESSWVLRRELRANLRSYRPRLVLLLAGVNDVWRTRPDDADLEGEESAWRLARTWDLLRSRFARGEPVHDGPVRARGGRAPLGQQDREGGLRELEALAGAPGPAEYLACIERDVARAVAIAREEGATPVVLGYPATGHPFDGVTEALQRAALASDAPFVDFRPAFAEALLRVPWRVLFHPDRHLRAPGCDLMARVLVHELDERGLVRVDRRPGLFEGLPGGVEPELVLEPLWRGGSISGARVRHEPGRDVVLLLSGAPGEVLLAREDGRLVVASTESQRGAARAVPLAADALLARSLASAEERGVALDADGAARLRVPRWSEVRARKLDGVYACAVVLPRGPGPPLAVSEVLEVSAGRGPRPRRGPAPR